MKSYFKQKTFRSKKYRDYIRSLPCIICGKKSVNHHMRIDGNAGIGIKPSDLYGLPLCNNHHSEGHKGGFKTFLEKYGINVYKVLFETIKGYVEGGIK